MAEKSAAPSVSTVTVDPPEHDQREISHAPPSNPFASPFASTRASSINNSSAVDFSGNGPSQYFRSRRIKKGEVERPWLEKKDPREKWVTIIPLLGIALGFGICGVLIWDGLKSVVNHNYCPVLDENWANGIDSKIWTKEVQSGGFGNGEFEMTTNTDENVFVKDGIMYIKPTLQDANLITTNNTINLTELGTCTSTVWSDCVATTNTTNGTIVNPVKSGRMTTLKGATIKYGRVEVVAQIPAGDWLWPAIWLLPVNSTYGAWPRSGEIDIMESRGNNYTYPSGGDNIISSTLHWGPNPSNDAFWRTNNKQTALHTTYASGFNTYGLEWSEKYLFTYVNSRLMQVLYVNFDESLWARGNFPLTNSNGTAISDPWSSGSFSTPFDQEFYLILNVAVGGTNGWFTDGANGKPWVDSSPTAKKDFWNAQSQWYPTWQANNGGQMAIKSVKMWQQEGYQGCTNGVKLR